MRQHPSIRARKYDVHTYKSNSGKRRERYHTSTALHTYHWNTIISSPKTQMTLDGRMGRRADGQTDRRWADIHVCSPIRPIYARRDGHCQAARLSTGDPSIPPSRCHDDDTTASPGRRACLYSDRTRRTLHLSLGMWIYEGLITRQHDLASSKGPPIRDIYRSIEISTVVGSPCAIEPPLLRTYDLIMLGWDAPVLVRRCLSAFLFHPLPPVSRRRFVSLSRPLPIHHERALQLQLSPHGRSAR